MSKGLPMINLAELPFPPVVEALSFEQVLAQARTKFVEFWEALRLEYPSLPPYSVDMLDSDPAIIVLQAFAFREVIARARVNDAAKALMLATAVGDDLQHFAADFGLVRAQVRPATEDAPAVMETEESLRERRRLAPDGYAAGGPGEAYEFHARTVAPELKGALAVKGEGNRVDLVLLGLDGDGAVSSEIIARVHQRLSPRNLRPLTDALYVRSAAIIHQKIRVRGALASGPDRELIRTRTIAGIQKYASERHGIGRPLFVDGIIAGGRKDGGWETLAVLEPAADVDPGRYGAIFVPSIEVEFAP